MKDWLEVGRDVMESARAERGLSMEAAARALHISSRTYDRHEKAGRIPRYQISDYARVLGLEIIEPEKRRVDLPLEEATTAELLEEVRRQGEVLARLEERILGTPEPEVPPRSKRAQGGSR